jgi:hypothetical protein
MRPFRAICVSRFDARVSHVSAIFKSMSRSSGDRERPAMARHSAACFLKSSNGASKPTWRLFQPSNTRPGDVSACEKGRSRVAFREPSQLVEVRPLRRIVQIERRRRP